MDREQFAILFNSQPLAKDECIEYACYFLKHDVHDDEIEAMRPDVRCEVYRMQRDELQDMLDECNENNCAPKAL